MGGRSPRQPKACGGTGVGRTRTVYTPDTSHAPVAAQIGDTIDERPRTERHQALASGPADGSMPGTADLPEVGWGCARCLDPSGPIIRARLSRLARPTELLVEGYSALWSLSEKASQMASGRPRGEDEIARETTAGWPKRSFYTSATPL